MARANRHFMANRVWHLTQRCHKRQWLLKFNIDKRNWLHWLYEARRRYGLSVLNYVVTSNHVHLLVWDKGGGEIAKGMQLIAGRTAQEYNQRKHRSGAFWQDRYHATAVQSDTHLHRCLSYIDLNMVRAGEVNHPCQWQYGGFAEIQQPRQRYSRIDFPALLTLLNLQTIEQLQESRRSHIKNDVYAYERNAIWTEAAAVGNEHYILQVKALLRVKNPGRTVLDHEGDFVLKEDTACPYRPYNAISAVKSRCKTDADTQ